MIGISTVLPITVGCKPKSKAYLALQTLHLSSQAHQRVQDFSPPWGRAQIHTDNSSLSSPQETVCAAVLAGLPPAE